MTYLQALILLQLANRLLREHMTARDEVDRLNAGTELLGRHGTDPALASIKLMTRMLLALRINLELQLHHVAQSLNPSTQELFAVGPGADALGLFAGEEELQNGVFVVEVAGAIGDDRTH